MYRVLFFVVYIFFCFTVAHSQKLNITIHSVNFDESFDKFDSDELQEAAGLQSIYNPLQNNTYALKLENYLQQQGYLYARIAKISALYNADSSSADLVVSGSPGSLVAFGDIVIHSDSLDIHNYQNMLTVQKYDPYSQASIENDISLMLSLAADSGFVYARAKIQNISIVNDDGQLFARIDIKISEGEIVEINDIEISGNHYTQPGVILRELPVKKGQKYSKSAVAKIPQRLMRIGIFKDVKTPSMIVNNKGEYILKLKVKEGNATTFDGVVGYIPENKNLQAKNSGGYFTGLVDVTFNNLFGTARRFDVHWEKPDKYSENFFLKYTEP